MELSQAERVVLDRYHEKCLVAGGPKAGYNLRRASILYHRDRHEGVDLDGAIDSLVEKGLLKANEDGSRLVLAAAGVEQLQSLAGA